MFDLRKYLRRALWRTSASVGGWPLFWTVFAIPVVGFVLHYLIAGGSAMDAELQIWLIYGLAATGVVFGALFVWNLVFAPYQIEFEAHQHTKRELERTGLPTVDAIANLISKKETFALWEAAHLLASTQLDRTNIVGPASSYLQEMKKRLAMGTIDGAILRNKGPFTGKEAEEIRTFVVFLGPHGAADHISIDSEISKSQLASLAEEYQVVIPGLTVAVPSPQSPSSPETGTQPKTRPG